MDSSQRATKRSFQDSTLDQEPLRKKARLDKSVSFSVEGRTFYILNPDKTYICPVCLEHPAHYPTCGDIAHICCRMCTIHLNECPLCKDSLVNDENNLHEQLYRKHKATIWRMVEEVVVFCKHCGWDGLLTESADHINNCQKSQNDEVDLPESKIISVIPPQLTCKCGYFVPNEYHSKLFQHHKEQVCPLESVKCGIGDCTKTLQRSEIEVHRNMCRTKNYTQLLPDLWVTPSRSHKDIYVDVRDSRRLFMQMPSSLYFMRSDIAADSSTLRMSLPADKYLISPIHSGNFQQHIAIKYGATNNPDDGSQCLIIQPAARESISGFIHNCLLTPLEKRQAEFRFLNLSLFDYEGNEFLKLPTVDLSLIFPHRNKYLAINLQKFRHEKMGPPEEGGTYWDLINRPYLSIKATNDEKEVIKTLSLKSIPKHHARWVLR